MDSDRFVLRKRLSAPVRRERPLAKDVHAATLSLCFIATGCLAQNAPLTHPGLVATAPIENAAAHAPYPAARQPFVATGTLSRFLINPEGDVDGLLLTDGSIVHFPPLVSAKSAALLHQGDELRIVGARDAAGNVTAQGIDNERTSQSVLDQAPPSDAMRAPPPLHEAPLIKLSAEGTVVRITTAPHGEPDGVLLQDGTIIKMPPPIAQQFAYLLRPDAVVAARGYGTRNQYGEALQATAFGTPGNLTQLYDTPN